MINHLKTIPSTHQMMSLNAALHTLYSQDAPTFSYQQCIDVRNIDRDYESLVRYQVETLRIQFPREAVSVRGFRSSSPCKIVAYQQIGPMIEVEVKQGMEIAVLPETVCLVYTRSKKDFRLWFELVLRKPKTRAAL